MAVIVVGMHRSGTSAVASAIEALGISTGDSQSLMAPDQHNQGGYFEQLGAVELNNEILDYLGGTALEPTVLPSDWRDDDFLVASVTRIRDLLSSLFTDSRYVLKDPRISVLLPLWREAIGSDLVFAYVVRDPWEVALSLQRRDASQLETGVAAWVQYNQALARDLEGARVHALSYQELLDDPISTLESLRVSLVEWGQAEPTAMSAEAAARIDVAQHRNVVAESSNVDSSLQHEVSDLFARYLSWRGRHEHFSTPTTATPWWCAALLAERRANLRVQRHLQHEIDKLRAGYEILDDERHRLEESERALRNNILVRPALAVRRLVRRTGGDRD